MIRFWLYGLRRYIYLSYEDGLWTEKGRAGEDVPGSRDNRESFCFYLKALAILVFPALYAVRNDALVTTVISTRLVNR